MAGDVVTKALKINVSAPEVFAVPAFSPVRLITASASTAKVEYSTNGGYTWKTWAFGTQAAGSTQEQKFPIDVLVRGVAVTGTATLEIDDPDADGLLFVKGTPASLVAAPAGTVAIRYDGGEDTIVYVKESGTDASGWAPLTDAA